MSRHILRLGYLSAALLLFSSLAFSLAQTGSLSGTVLDANDAVIAGAAVDAREMNTGVSAHTVSSDAGLYVFPNLPTGMWSISAEKPGFKKLVRTGIEIFIAQRQALDSKREIVDVK